MYVAGRCCDIKNCHKMYQRKIQNLTKCEILCHLRLQKRVWRRKKGNLQKCGEKSATRKKWCESCYQDAYSCIFIICILYQLNFQMQKNTLNYVFVLSKWNFESWYATKYSYFNKTYMITFLHLKMGKSLHESETSKDNDIVYGVLVEIWLELIIQNKAREKQGEPLWTESKIAILTTPNTANIYLCMS